MPKPNRLEIEHQHLKKWGGSYGFPIPGVLLDMYGLDPKGVYTLVLIEEKGDEKHDE